jgi:5-methylcytosine-specific restriction protein B
MQEYDALGQDVFLKKYGYAPAHGYRLVHDGKSYDSKAIVGVAFKYQFPGRAPLERGDFSGGEATVVPLLERLGFEVRTIGRREEPNAATITSEDIQLLRQSRGKSKYSDLSPDERSAYERVHRALEVLGSAVREALKIGGPYNLKMTSGFNLKSGIRGFLPKDLWFAVSNDRNDAFEGMPQLFMIASSRGLEYGFAASIHPIDFSTQKIKQRFRAVAPEIFKELPLPGSEEAVALQASLASEGGWFFRRKTRLEPNISDFESLDEWLSFLKSRAGSEWAAGSISRYVLVDDLKNPDFNLRSLMQQMAAVFAPLMASATPKPPAENAIQKGLESFLATFPSIRSSVPFGQHDQLKNELNQIRSAIEALPTVRAHPTVRVSWSVGQGFFAHVPWIALVDERETTSTQRGTYCAFLFPEDMSGVYLTLNQGVTDVIKEHGRTEGRRILRDRAQAVRGDVGASLHPYSIDDGIKLNTDGVLGLDYEASTIAYRYYAKGEIPDDKTLNMELGLLLDVYDRVLKQRPIEAAPTTQWWIFQAHPKIFDIDSALRDLSELTWTVRHEATRAAVGDRVFIWRAGREAGVVALGTIIEEAVDRDISPDELPYLLDTERLGGLQARVKVRIDQRLDEPLLRTAIAAEARLKDLMILRFANYGTFKLAPHHAAALVEMIEDIEERPATTDREPHRRVWIYAPGENAEHWDELYENGIMAIGWDGLGDLSRFGSIDDVLAALQRQYEPQQRPTNNARTCYDFAHTIQIGDRVFAKRGRNTIIGHGVVTGEYEYRAERPVLKNVRTIRWEGRDTWTSPASVAIKTLTDVSGDRDFVTSLEKLVLRRVSEPPKPIPPAEPYTVEQALDGLFMDEELFRRTLAVWGRKKNLVLQGPPGVGKSFVAKRLAYALMGYRDPSRVRTVQFHQSYSYEDFVQGYRPTGSGLTLQPGVFFEFCNRALADPDETYVFIIDEINRGNLSKIFGELMLLIEPDKRSAEWATKLAYAPAAEERFYVPPNVFLLGMMNTADRSLSLVDYALRRRFAFVALEPEYTSEKFRQQLTQRGAPIELIDRIIERMTAINEEIESDKTNLGRGFCIGHSFFVPTSQSEQLDLQWYQRVMETEILPLLEEYWFDNPNRAKEWRDRLLAE